MEEAEGFPWATTIMILLVIVIVVGGAITVVSDETFSSHGYFRDVALLSIGVGLLGVGRGIRSGLRRWIGGEDKREDVARGRR